MAGDTYSIIIDNFAQENVGRYSVTAENPSGKATCSASVTIEGNLKSKKQTKKKTEFKLINFVQRFSCCSRN